MQLQLKCTSDKMEERHKVKGIIYLLLYLLQLQVGFEVTEFFPDGQEMKVILS